MINQSTMDKLIEMRLTAMADAFRIQMDDSSMKDISFIEESSICIRNASAIAVRRISISLSIVL